MKKIFTLCFSLFATYAITAQSLEIRDNTGTVLLDDDTTVIHAGLSSDFDIKAEGYRVYNTSGSSINVACKRIEMATVTGTANALCWTVCSMDYAAGAQPVLVAPGGPQTIAPGAYSDLFVLHYKPWNNTGTATYRVTFYNTSNVNDSVSFIVRFDAALSVPETAKTPSVNAYPNPASSFINFDFDQVDNNTNIRIVDVLGSTVKTIAVTSDNLRVPVADLKEGVYFYSLMNKNKAIITRRMVISR